MTRKDLQHRVAIQCPVNDFGMEGESPSASLGLPRSSQVSVLRSRSNRDRFAASLFHNSVQEWPGVRARREGGVG
jgi:hypothetical protein